MGTYMKLFTNLYFAMFIGALTLLNIGRKLSWVALGWFVYETTGAASAIGIVLSAATIAPLISSILVGGILDQYDRKKTMAIENAVRGLLILLIPLFHWSGVLTLGVLITVMFIDGFLSSFTKVGASSILPAFVESEELEAGNAVISMVSQIGTLLGPALGGFLTAWIGAPGTLLVNVVLFFSATIIYIGIPRHHYHQGMEHDPSGPSSGWMSRLHAYGRDTKAGIQFIMQYRILIFIACVTLLFNFTYAPFEAVLPAFVNDALQAEASVLGMMWSTFSVGALTGAALWIRLSMKLPYSYVLGVVIILWGLAPFTVAFLNEPWLIYIVMFLGGVFYAPYNIVAPTLKQRLVPNALRGRVFGVYNLIAGLGLPIGMYLGGLSGDLIGLTETVALSGVATVLLGLLVMIAKPLRIRHVSHLQQPS
ncbi:MFS transporter [Thalassobacillus sp. CUG 92003]|uniref:MFS transporter n=1 Tax=Thalassobacillus sp. CUG 92003 TaxID=2736641 RepID=UPI0015E6C44A|nr:MFS transporter [Thalassobacillus sp. CUG 92003]